MINKVKSNKLPSHIQFDTVSPATKLLEKRRKMYEVNEAFESQKDEFKKKEDIFKRYEESIRERDMAVQADLINFCKFLQENEAKKNRAEKRLFDEKKARQQKEKEILLLKKECEELQRLSEKFDKKLGTLKKYEEYLDNVIKTEDQYQDVPQILTLYTKLTTSYEELNKKHKQMEKEYERIKYDSKQFEKEQNQEILQLNNDIKDLTKKLEDRIFERNQIQSVVESSSSEASQMHLTLGRMLMAVDNLYDRSRNDKKKVRQEYLDYMQDNNENDKKKADQDKLKKLTGKDAKKDSEEVDEAEQDDYDKKTKVAVAKLKYVSEQIKFFKKILDNLKAENKLQKQNAKNNNNNYV